MSVPVRARRGASLKALWPFSRRRPLRGEECIACGRTIASTEHAIDIQGDAYHGGCALYSRRDAGALMARGSSSHG